MKDRDIHDESNVWSTAQRLKKNLMLCLNEIMDQIISSVHWSYGNVLRREDGYVLRRALDSEVDSQGKKEMMKRTWKKPVEEESVKVGFRMEDALCHSKWIVDINQIADGLR